MRTKTLWNIVVAAAFGAAALSLAGCNTCTSRPPIRAIDHACLPAGGAPTKGDIELYRGDIDAQYVQVATIDSFVCDASSDTDYPVKEPSKPTVSAENVRKMLEDLKGKGRAAGADALIRVKMLHRVRTGFKNNPRTPFPSVEQGEWRDYFMRGIAIKYLKRPKGTPAFVPESQLPPPQSAVAPPRPSWGTLSIPAFTTPQPVAPQVQAPER